MLAQGTILHNRFEILEQIDASSGCSTNYKAIDQVTDEIVAVKKITSNQESLEQAEILGLFENSDCVLKCIASFTENEEDFIVTEFCHYGDFCEFFNDVADNTIITTQWAVSVMKRLTEIVRTLHLKQVYHGDIKFENFFVKELDDGAFQIVIGDFGFSKVLRNGERIITSRLTQCYASPQLRHHQPVDFSADVYSLGCVFEQIVSCINDYVPESLNEMINSMLAENEEDRINIFNVEEYFRINFPSPFRTS